MRVNPCSFLSIGFIWCTLFATIFSHTLINTVGVDARDTGWKGSRIRSRRAGNNSKITELSDKISVLARITNAVYLQAGLMNKTVPIESMIGELLNFSPLKMSEVEKFKGDKVSALLKEIKEISGKIDSSQDTKTMEDFVTSLNSIKEIAKLIGSHDDFPSGDTYFQDIKNFHDNFNFSAITMNSVFSGLNSNLGKVALMDAKAAETDVDEEKINMVNTFQMLDLKLKQSISLFQTTLSAVRNDVAKYGDLLKEPYELTPVWKLIESMKKRASIQRPAGAGDDLVKRNVLAVADLANITQLAQPDLKFLIKLVTSRVHPQLLSRSFTPAFIHGIVDVNKLTDDSKLEWLKKLFHPDKLSKLDDGLRPISKAKVELSAANAKLVASSTLSKLSATRAVERLLLNFTSASTKADDVPSIISSLVTCYQQSGSPIMDRLKTDFITKAEFLRKTLGSIIPSIDSVLASQDGLRLSDLTEFRSFLSFSDTNNQNAVIEDAKKFLPMLKGNESTRLTDFKRRVSITNLAFEKINKTEMESAVKELITNGKSQLDTFKDDSQVKNEYKIYACLKTVESENLAETIEQVRRASRIGDKQASEVEKVVEAVVKFSTGISSLKNISEIMKTEKSEASNALETMPGLAQGAVPLGVSAKNLYNIQKFSALDLASLQNIDNLVSGEIAKLPIEEQTAVSTQWGNYQSDYNALTQRQQEVSRIESKLNLSKANSLKELGDALGEVENLKNLTINAEKKSAVIGVLIERTADPTVKSTLGSSKNTLDELASLDLNFASGSSSVGDVSGFLDRVQGFLNGFLKEKHNTSPQIPGPRPPPGSGPKPMSIAPITKGELGKSSGWTLTEVLLIVGAVAGVLIIIGIILFCFREKISSCLKKKKRASRKSITKWITKQAFEHPKLAYAAHYSQFVGARMFLNTHVTVEMEEKDKSFLPATKRRHCDIFCNERRSVKIKDGKQLKPIHANYIQTEESVLFIATQGPLKRNEGYDNKDETCEDFWAMVYQEKCEFIVMLCNFKEEGKPKCGEYFRTEKGKSEKFGKFKVTTKLLEKEFMKDEEFGDIIDKRIIVVTPEKGAPITVTHFHYKTWPDMEVPKSPKVCYDLHDAVKNSKAPVVVHCSAGVGRTVSFIGMKYMAQKAKYNTKTTLTDVITELRDIRWHGIQSWQQTYFIQLGAVYFLIKEYGLKEKLYEKQFEMYSTTLVKGYSTTVETKSEMEKRVK